MDDLEQRLRAVEATQIVHEAQLNELHAWRRRDEPRIVKLVTAAQVADEVRQALSERTRHEWSIGQKILAGVIAAPTFLAGVIALATQLHHIFS